MVSNLQIDKIIKMKEIMKTKLLCMMLYMGMLTSVFISCGSNDDDNNEASITKEEVVGTWTVIDGYETNGEKTNTSSIGKTVIFNADGTGSVSIADIKWSLSGNRFSYYYTSNSKTVFSGTFSYSNGILIMKGSGNGWTFEYKMKKTS